MKVVYVCSLCGFSSKEKQAVKNCEASHHNIHVAKVVQAVDYPYRAQLPNKIVIQFSNDVKASYYFNRREEN